MPERPGDPGGRTQPHRVDPARPPSRPRRLSGSATSVALVSVVGVSLAAVAGTSLFSGGSGGTADPALQEQSQILLAQADSNDRDARRERRQAERRAERQAERREARREARRAERRAQRREMRRAERRGGIGVPEDLVLPPGTPAAERARMAAQRASRAPELAREHPERVSLNAMAKPLMRADGTLSMPVEEYAQTAEPSRVYDTLDPGPGLPVLQIASPAFVEVQPGEQVELSVRAIPGAPVSYASAEGGCLQNGLNAVTVIADEDGLATAVFTATSDVVGEVAVAVGCPLTCGRGSFLLVVPDPSQETGDEEGGEF